MKSAPRLIDIPTIWSPHGNIGVIESEQVLSFEVRRVYFITSVPPSAKRGSHAHKLLEQLIVATSGSLTVTLDSGSSTESFVLDSPNKGLYVPPGYWRDLVDFSEETVCLVLASTKYDEADYLRDYLEFKKWRLFNG